MLSELEVYGTRPAGRRAMPVQSEVAAQESAPVSVLTSAGPEDETGWAAVDGDPETVWIGQKPGGGYLVVEYAPTLTLRGLEVDFAEGSLTNMECLYSLDAEEWAHLPGDLKDHPVSMKYLWVMFPGDESGAAPGVIEIRPTP